MEIIFLYSFLYCILFFIVFFSNQYSNKLLLNYFSVLLVDKDNELMICTI